MGSRVWNPPFEVGFMVKLQAIESGFRKNPNKSVFGLCMGYDPYWSCLEVIHERFLKIHMY